MTKTMCNEATTGVVAAVRPAHLMSLPFGGASAGASITAIPRTQVPVFAALYEGSGLTFDRKNGTDLSTQDTQDPSHFSGKQLWTHPPV